MSLGACAGPRAGVISCSSTKMYQDRVCCYYFFDMIPHIIIAAGVFVSMFVLFLVLSKTMNNMVNLLTKLEYLVQKDLDYQKESKEIQRLLEIEELKLKRRRGEIELPEDREDESGEKGA